MNKYLKINIILYIMSFLGISCSSNNKVQNICSRENKAIEVVAYNPEWLNIFEKEAEVLKKAFGDNLGEIYHIGSTSVPGLSAKPIIDIMVTVRNLKKTDICEIEKLGYIEKGEISAPMHLYFSKKGVADEKGYHLHVFEVNNLLVKKILIVRDYFRNHIEVAHEYSLLKEQLAEKHQDGMNYLRDKLLFLDNVLKKTRFEKNVFDFLQSSSDFENYLKIQSEQDPHSKTAIFEPIESSGYEPKIITYTKDQKIRHFYIILHNSSGLVGISHVFFENEETAQIKLIAAKDKDNDGEIEVQMLKFIEKWAEFRGKKYLELKITKDSKEFYKNFGYEESKNLFILRKTLPHYDI